MKLINDCNQEVGSLVKDWQPRPWPEKATINGKYCRLEPLNSNKHAAQLFEAYKKLGNDAIWTYIPVGPFDNFETYRDFINGRANSTDAIHYAIVSNTTHRAVGTFCLMRIDKENGVTEVGFVIFSPDLQKTTMATEAHYLLMKHVFEVLKFRRFEWKCSSLNEPSRRAATRLGFQYEGTFRQAAVMKGRNRDTNWFSVIDKEWKSCRKAFELWLSEENFQNGKQIKGLAEIRNGF